MVMLYVAGKPIGTLAEAEKLLPEILARGDELEFRDETGITLRKYTATPGPIIPWEPSVTQEEVDRRIAGEFVTFDEVKKRLGWE
jgi:hypothetical protein